MPELPIAHFDRGSGAREALESLAGSEAFRSSRFSSKVYADEPIVKTGRELARELGPSLPYQRIHQLSRREDLRYASTAQVFYEQGLLLETCEDDLPGRVAFASYFPTYQVMDERQLRGYLSWRTSLRARRLEPAPVGFAFVHIYELLMGIGVPRGEEGFRTLMSFWQSWKEQSDEPAVLDQYLRVWLRDYVVYNGLPREFLGEELLLRGKAADEDLLYRNVPLIAEAQRRVAVGETLAGADAERLFEALCACSSFRLTTSKFYKDYPQEAIAASCGVFARLVAHCASRRKVGLVEGLFGESCLRRHAMFASAVFYDPAPHPDCTYTVSPYEEYSCRDGRWTRRVPCTASERSSELGKVFRALDHRLRLVYGHPSQVREQKLPKYQETFVAKEVEARHAWYEAHVPKPIALDRSMLRGIRKAAAKTREALLVEEERLEEGAPPKVPAVAPEPVCAPVPGVAPEPAPAALVPPPSCADFLLDARHLAALRAVVAADEGAFWAAVGPGMASLVVDALNEALFDLVGDAVLEGEGFPQLVEDYREEICAFLGADLA